MTIDVIRLAREAGIEWQQHTGVIGRITVTTCGSQSLERIERFAALVMEEDARASRDRVAELEATNAELLTALVDVSYTLEKARIWGGMEWKYNPLHPVHYLPARDKAREAIKKHGGAK